MQKRTNPSSNYPHAETTFPACSSTPLLLMILPTETRNTYTSADPAFPYLLCFFLFLTSFAWSLAYANAAAGNIIRIAFLFVFVHCLLSSLLVATFMYFFTGKALGPGGFLVGRGGGRRRGLFGGAGEGLEELEFGYCFDVSYNPQRPLEWERFILIRNRCQSEHSSRYGCSCICYSLCCYLLSLPTIG